MRTKIKDISEKKASEGKINLQHDKKKRKPIAKKEQLKFQKSENPIHKVTDIKGQKTSHFAYIKAKKFTPPKSLSNLLRLGFSGILILIIINAISIYTSTKSLQEKIKADALEGFSYLVDAGESATKTEYEKAVASFNEAIANFEQAEEKLWFISEDNSFYAKDANVTQAVSTLLKAGKEFSLSGNDFLDALEEFNKIPLYFTANNSEDTKIKPSITDTLKDGLSKTDQALIKVNNAWDLISEIREETLPTEIRARVVYARSQVEKVKDLLNSVSSHFPALLKLLGDRYPHRYLVILQNNNETRATGGFIGSYAIIDINEGYIEKLEVHDVYDIDNSYGGYIEPPKELEPHTTNLRFRDSNYSHDFELSARKLMWVLEKEGGPSVDTVIGINQGLLVDLLNITGPIQVGEFGALSAENYSLLLSFIIEGKIWGAEDPKHILKVFIPAFKEEILQEEHLAKLGFKLHRALEQKHILFFAKDQEIQNFFESYDIAGKVHELGEKEDYLSVINWSTGGTKSDQYIEEHITHHSDISATGDITNTVTIKRTHTWSEEILKDWEETLQRYGLSTYGAPGILIDILGRGRNRVTIRTYVPPGSILIDSSASDTETIYDSDLKLTYFKTEMELLHGESEELTLKYLLPYQLAFNDSADTYKIIVEKQPGTPGALFTKTIAADPELKQLSLYPKEHRLNHSGDIVFATNLVYDQYFAGVWTK